MVVRFGEPEVLERVSRILEAGGVVIMPCDTIYGIVGRAPDSEERIRSLKGRTETAPFIVLVPDAAAAERASSGPIDPRIASLWPAPLTVVVPGKEGKSVGLRVPADPFLLSVLRRVAAGLYSTSVNHSGRPPLERISEILAEFENEVELVVDGGDLPGRRPSTLLDITGRPYRILRQGAFQVPPELLR